MKLLSAKPRHNAWGSPLGFFMLATAASAAPAAWAADAIPTVSGDTAYHVVNLAPGTGVVALNRMGQVAFSTYAAGATFNGFFDGRKVVDVHAPGGRFVQVNGLNDKGVVVGQFDDPATPAPSNYRAFTWTVAGGLKALPGPGTASARAINPGNQVAGSVKGNAFYGRAYRWNPDGTARELGPLPASLSEALAINPAGVAVGYADVALYDSHAVVWDADGNATDLGTMGGSQSTAQYVNFQGQVAGSYYRDGVPGAFLWTRAGGVTKIAPNAAAGVRLAGLNDNGDVAVNLPVTADGAAAAPHVWSRGQGLRRLPLGGAVHGSVGAINNRSVTVGAIERTPDPSGQRAVRWMGLSNPVDLNQRLIRPPAGLVLYAAKAVNDIGDIVAESNAGLVLLRPGNPGTDAPVLGPVTAALPDDNVTLASSVDFSVAFTDNNLSETHVAPAVREVRGGGTVDVRHAFCRAGTYTLTVRVTDRAGNATTVQRTLSVQESSAAP